MRRVCRFGHRVVLEELTCGEEKVRLQDGQLQAACSHSLGTENFDVPKQMCW